MFAPQNQLSTNTHHTIDVPTNFGTVRNDRETDSNTRRRDTFLFYSDPANLNRRLNMQSEASDAEHAPSDIIKNQVARKTRISFEKDPLALLMEDEEFRTDMDILDELMDESDTVLLSEILDELKLNPEELKLNPVESFDVTLPSVPRAREVDRKQFLARGA